MQTFNHVEDYLEILGGYSPKGTKPTTFMYEPLEFSIRLARYDISVISNMSGATITGQSLTDKQAELAIKLILKYRKQLAKHEIDITPIENAPQFRQPLREVNRVKILEYQDNNLVLKFPYDRDLIDQLHKFRENSQGRVTWNNYDKEWSIAPTEQNIEWIVQWCNSSDISVASDIEQVYHSIGALKEQDFSIRLKRNSDHTGFEIENASSSLIDYINDNLGGFGKDNEKVLVDQSGILGYQVDQSILKQCSPSMRAFSGKQRTFIQPTVENLDLIFDYAEETNRYPICIYNPKLEELDLSRFKQQDIVRFDEDGKTNTSDYNPYCVKIVYAKKVIPDTWKFPVPLMVTTFEMMYGGKKTQWSNRAEKIIYYCETQLKEDNPWRM